MEVCEHLLENGADVNVQDKGGLIPLHNASSYGHVDIAQLLIKYNASVNAVDKWGFTPLHEASQKGRTQLCALLVILATHILYACVPPMCQSCQSNRCDVSENRCDMISFSLLMERIRL